MTVDYYSSFFEIDFLSDTSSEFVISKLKHHFARHGIPDVVISDGGPQYSSSIFGKFSKTWNFRHEVTSPGNSKASGAAEAAGKSAKRILRKCHAAHEDPYLGLLNFRNTPTEGMNASPAQRLLGRRTKTTMPSTFSLLKPTSDSVGLSDIKRDEKRTQIADRVNQHRYDLKPLRQGDAVYLQPLEPHKKEWRPARVTMQLTSHTYEVATSNGNILRRNRQFMRKSRTVENGEDEFDIDTCP